MKYTEFEFNGQSYALSFTAEALFTIYEKYGVSDNILEASKAFEPTPEGFTNLCWLLALLAAQGELQRRHRGETPHEMLTLEDIRTGAMAGDIPRLRAAVRGCLEQGFAHEPTEAEAREAEINLVLQSREAAAKKARQLARSVLDTWRQLPDFLVSHFTKPSS